MKPAVIGLAARSGTGKTTLLVQLLPLFRQKNIHVAVIKHSHHDFEIDYPDKDSYRARAAGAEQILIASPGRLALIQDISEPEEPELDRLLNRLDTTALDLVLVEGFRHIAFRKIELHRKATGQALLCHDDPSIIAVASDAPVDTALPQLDINNPGQIADFIIEQLQPGTVE